MTQTEENLKMDSAKTKIDQSKDLSKESKNWFFIILPDPEN